MLENVTIKNPKFADDFDTIIELSEDDRNKKDVHRTKDILPIVADTTGGRNPLSLI